MEATEAPQDEFVKAKYEWLEKLQKCQNENSIDSCLKCPKVVGCELRNGYVKAFFQSMNKGEGGDFEF